MDYICSKTDLKKRNLSQKDLSVRIWWQLQNKIYISEDRLFF